MQWAGGGGTLFVRHMIDYNFSCFSYCFCVLCVTACFTFVLIDQYNVFNFCGGGWMIFCGQQRHSAKADHRSGILIRESMCLHDNQNFLQDSFRSDCTGLPGRARGIVNTRMILFCMLPDKYLPSGINSGGKP